MITTALSINNEELKANKIVACCLHQQGNTTKFSLSLHWSTIQLTTRNKSRAV